jgi:tRNA(Ile)-lysidine synthase
MALLHLFATKWADRLGQADQSQIRVAHFDHGSRPDSHLDRRLVEQAAAIYGLPFHFEEAKLGRVSENTARKARYNFLNRVLSQTAATAIITAHHLDDRHETSIFNLLRGSNRHGLAPMSVPNPDASTRPNLLRPLLSVSKRQLLEYAIHHGLPWREDSTNRDLSYSRNFIRHELLPLARHLQPDFDTGYLARVESLESINRTLDRELANWFKRHSQTSSHTLSLPRRELWRLSHTALTNLLAFAVNQTQPGSQLSAKNLHQLARLIKTGSVGRQKTIIRGLRVVIGYDTVALVSGETTYPLASPDDQSLVPGTSVRHGRFQVSSGYLGRHLPGAVNVRQLPLKVRGLQPGDVIHPVGMTGKKKLQDLFVDRKVPRSERVSYPVVTSYNGEVVWVPGLAVGRQFTTQAGDTSGQCLTYSLI